MGCVPHDGQLGLGNFTEQEGAVPILGDKDPRDNVEVLRTDATNGRDSKRRKVPYEVVDAAIRRSLGVLAGLLKGPGCEAFIVLVVPKGQEIWVLFFGCFAPDESCRRAVVLSDKDAALDANVIGGVVP